MGMIGVWPEHRHKHRHCIADSAIIHTSCVHDEAAVGAYVIKPRARHQKPFVPHLRSECVKARVLEAQGRGNEHMKNWV
jgi:hypothetical protein